MLVRFSGVVLNVTYTPRSGKHRIVSARLASQKERRLFDGRDQSS